MPGRHKGLKPQKATISFEPGPATDRETTDLAFYRHEYTEHKKIIARLRAALEEEESLDCVHCNRRDIARKALEGEALKDAAGTD